MKYPEDYINKIICGDCLEVMKDISNKSVDLIVTDPPYGVRKKEEWDNKNDFIKNIELWFREFFRVSKYGVIIFCAGKMIPYLIKNREEEYQRILVWNKPPGSQFAGACNNKIWYSIEPILIFSQNYEELKKNYGEDCEHAYQFFDTRTIPFSKYKHPTTKSVLLMEWLILHFSKKRQIILDPFSGSGTTAVACKETSRKYIGIEINPEYCEIARKRVNNISELLF